MEKKFSLRERKKIQTKISVLNAMLDGLSEKTFNEIRVEDICEKVNISKVTFFKYFSMKEDVLDYFVLRWQYERTIEIHQKRFIGLEGIYQVFKSVSEVPNADKIIVSLINYYSKIRNRPRKLELTAYERFTVDPQFENEHPIEILPLDKIFEVYIAESRHILCEDKDKYINQLITLFYGVPFQVHIRMLEKGALSNLYKESLDLLFINKSG